MSDAGATVLFTRGPMSRQASEELEWSYVDFRQYKTSHYCGHGHQDAMTYHSTGKLELQGAGMVAGCSRQRDGLLHGSAAYRRRRGNLRGKTGRSVYRQCIRSSEDADT